MSRLKSFTLWIFRNVGARIVLASFALHYGLQFGAGWMRSGMDADADLTKLEFIEKWALPAAALAFETVATVALLLIGVVIFVRSAFAAASSTFRSALESRAQVGVRSARGLVLWAINDGGARFVLAGVALLAIAAGIGPYMVMQYPDLTVLKIWKLAVLLAGFAELTIGLALLLSPAITLRLWAGGFYVALAKYPEKLMTPRAIQDAATMQ